MQLYTSGIGYLFKTLFFKFILLFLVINLQISMAEILNTFRAKKVLEIVTCITAWIAVVVQAFLTTGTLANLFSYFTILTNLLVALSLSFSLFFPNSKAAIFFKRPSVKSAIALYIFIVALVYNTVLRGIFPISGWHLFIDTLLHVIVPLLYIIFWYLVVPKKALHWQDGISWIYFPLAYLLYSLIRGAIVQWYAYPFLDVNELGYTKVFINIAAMVAVFFVAGLGFIFINRLFGNKNIVAAQSAAINS